MARSSEVSGYFKQINRTTLFYYFPHDAETVLRKGLNAIYALDEIGQWSISNSHDSDDAKLNATAHEKVPMKCKKRVQNTDGGSNKNEGWVNSEKYIPIKYFCKNNNKSRENNNLNTNRHNIFTDDAEIDVEQGEDAVKTIMKEKQNNKVKEVKQEQYEKNKNFRGGK